MSAGIKIPIVVPWGMVAAALVAIIFMYRDVQTMKASMVSVERIAKLEASVDELKREDGELKDSIKALWRARSRPQNDD